MKTFLVVTHQRGFEADPVIDELRKRGREVFRLNTDDGEGKSLGTFYSDTGCFSLVCDGRKINTNDLGVGWFQQPPPYFGQTANNYECLQRTNLEAFQSSVFDLIPIPWVNKPRCIAQASNKVHQLSVAKNIGFRIPETIVSNEPTVIREFVRNRTVVAKNLATPWMLEKNGTRAAYTRIVSPSWLQADASLSFTPIIYQEYVERKRDLRIVMVGKKSFPVSCVPSEKQREDVRRECSTGEAFLPYDVSNETIQKLTQLMEFFSLDYCAADFMEDRNGNLYFLEVNTCGAWWWVDTLYDGLICQLIVDLLESKVKREG